MEKHVGDKDTNEQIRMYIYYYCSEFYHKLRECITGPNSLFFISKVVGSISDDLLENASEYSTIEELGDHFISMIITIDEKDYRDFQEILNYMNPKKKVKIYINQERLKSVQSMKLR